MSDKLDELNAKNPIGGDAKGGKGTKKRKRDEESLVQTNNISKIANKVRRNAEWVKLKRSKKKDKRQRQGRNLKIKDSNLYLKILLIMEYIGS